jgi:DNA invertase Pin-like site-specific DNA recombinase
MNVAAYLRVSTAQQDWATQRKAIQQAATARGDKIRRVEWYEEKSGRTGARAELRKIRESVRLGEIRKLYVYALDRLGEGIVEILTVVRELHSHGCELVSLRDPFDLVGPTAEPLIAMMAWAAEQERKRLRQRIRDARVRVEAEGGHWGRPRRVGAVTERRIRQLAKEGWTQRELSDAVKVPRSTVRAVLQKKGPYARD